MTTPKTPARLDANKTAEPLTRIVHHPPHGGCISPHMPLVAPEYEDEHGKRTPLTAEALVHFTPSEVALAKILAAWEEWPGWDGDGDDRADLAEIVAGIGRLLVQRGMVADLDLALADKGRALLDRARKAGVL